jgi:FkbM family methyltransferase
MKFSEHALLASYSYRNPHPRLVDVGAHTGGMAREFVRKGWRVVAFEPEHKNRATLIRNLTGFDNVTCISKAVADVTGDIVPFYVSDEHYGIHSLKPFHKTHRPAYEVETITLNDALEELKIRSVTLLRVDTEGADFLALKGFDFLKYNPELVMVEFMDKRSLPHFGYTHHDVAAYMKERGYVTFVSEWEPIREYAREGMTNPPHVWIQCVSYPLSHEPAWGNLFFVRDEDKDRNASMPHLNRI